MSLSKVTGGVQMQEVGRQEEEDLLQGVDSQWGKDATPMVVVGWQQQQEINYIEVINLKSKYTEEYGKPEISLLEKGVTKINK